MGQPACHDWFDCVVEHATLPSRWPYSQARHAGVRTVTPLWGLATCRSRTIKRWDLSSMCRAHVTVAAAAPPGSGGPSLPLITITSYEMMRRLTCAACCGGAAQRARGPGAAGGGWWCGHGGFCSALSEFAPACMLVGASVKCFVGGWFLCWCSRAQARHTTAHTLTYILVGTGTVHSSLVTCHLPYTQLTRARCRCCRPAVAGGGPAPPQQCVDPATCMASLPWGVVVIDESHNMRTTNARLKDAPHTGACYHSHPLRQLW